MVINTMDYKRKSGEHLLISAFEFTVCLFTEKKVKCSRKGKFDTCVIFAISWAILMSHKKIDSAPQCKGCKKWAKLQLESQTGLCVAL